MWEGLQKERLATHPEAMPDKIAVHDSCCKKTVFFYLESYAHKYQVTDAKPSLRNTQRNCDDDVARLAESLATYIRELHPFEY